MPTLRVLHQYPDMMPKLRADLGAIKFVLSGVQLHNGWKKANRGCNKCPPPTAGANIMCPGLTSPGATIHDEVPYELGCTTRTT